MNNVLDFFEQICAIPHGSGNEREICSFLVEFANERGLECYSDALFNVIIKKPATNGMESHEPVILQCHIDMVCEKIPTINHDFTKDPISIIKDGDYIRATGTTLGADNGIGAAYIMALLDSDKYEHPPIEAVFTTNEETGMDGALTLDMSKLSGKRLINLDSEEEGTLLVSCAGGMRVSLNIDNEWEELNNANCTFVEIAISNAKGGHSGMDINKGRGNAIILLARFLYQMANVDEIDFNISAFDCPGKDNVIPRNATSTIVVHSESEFTRCTVAASTYAAALQKEFQATDPNITVTLTKIDMPQANSQHVLTAGCSKNIIGMLLAIPNGVFTMSGHIDSLVESSNNIGTLQFDRQNTEIVCAIRSSLKSLKYFIYYKIQVAANAFGFDCQRRSEYPGWEYNSNSVLRDVFVRCYTNTHAGQKPKIEAIHAGLECGVFADKIPGIDIISLGPNMYDVHSPDERVSISSVNNVFEYLIEALKEL